MNSLEELKRRNASPEPSPPPVPMSTVPQEWLRRIERQQDEILQALHSVSQSLNTLPTQKNMRQQTKNLADMLKKCAAFHSHDNLKWAILGAATPTAALIVTMLLK